VCKNAPALPVFQPLSFLSSSRLARCCALLLLARCLASVTRWPADILAHGLSRLGVGIGFAPSVRQRSPQAGLHTGRITWATSDEQATRAKQKGRKRRAHRGQGGQKDSRCALVRCRIRHTRCLINVQHSTEYSLTVVTDYSVLLQRNVSSVQRR
jgi:hypothetical protein